MCIYKEACACHTIDHTQTCALNWWGSSPLKGFPQVGPERAEPGRGLCADGTERTAHKSGTWLRHVLARTRLRAALRRCACLHTAVSIRSTKKWDLGGRGPHIRSSLHTRWWIAHHALQGSLTSQRASVGLQLDGVCWDECRGPIRAPPTRCRGRFPLGTQPRRYLPWGAGQLGG